MAETVIEIKSMSRNGVTGHIEVDVCVVEIADDKTETRGVPETEGIDPLALAKRYHYHKDKTADGSVEDAQVHIQRWLAEVKERMVQRHKARTAAVGELQSLVGKRL
ncbi:MAG TPA: hypothetical protein VN861_03280 [Candidatus Acidoferrales bacterium]|nr:hypothetical protein [Candidatus Acidoferrales bacterium]